jgi:hypothetical protein
VCWLRLSNGRVTVAGTAAIMPSDDPMISDEFYVCCPAFRSSSLRFKFESSGNWPSGRLRPGRASEPWQTQIFPWQARDRWAFNLKFGLLKDAAHAEQYRKPGSGIRFNAPDHCNLSWLKTVPQSCHAVIQILIFKQCYQSCHAVIQVPIL